MVGLSEINEFEDKLSSDKDIAQFEIEMNHRVLF